MKFVTPTVEELSYLRADPLLWEQELDVRPKVAESVERAVGKRAGRSYWRSVHDHLYALELADLGRGRPSMAMVYGMWDRYEPRPPEQEIDADLIDFSLWIAEISEGLDPVNLSRVLRHDWHEPSWPEGSVLRTPAERFSHLPDFRYEPRFVETEGLRMAYVEAGDGQPILMLHGEPTWGYLYRRMIPTLAEVGRVIVPDLIGFGRSDKPVNDNAYSYRSHARWLRHFIKQLDLRQITLVCQDWGGLLGLRVLSETPGHFSRLVAMNTGIPDGRALGDAFHAMAAIRATSAATRRRRHRAKCPENARRSPTPKSTRTARPFLRPIIRRVRWLSRAWCRSAPIIPELTKIGSPSRVLSGSNCRYCCPGVTPIRCWENLSLS